MTRLFGVQRAEVVNVMDSPFPVPQWKSVGNLGHKAAVVCAKCNSGWMSVLESRAIPLLTPMIRADRRVTLTPEDQHIVATWVTKTHMMYRYRLSPQRPASASNHQFLYTNQEPPPRTLTLLAAWVGRDDSFIDVRVHLSRLSRVRETKANPVERFLTERFTIRIGHLVVQSLEVTPNASNADSVAFRDDSETRELFLNIWPNGPTAISWPPPRVLDDAGFERLTFRLATG
jgi:hypothetical protein